MEILLIVVVAVVIGALIFIKSNEKKLDTNNDGKVDVKEVKAAVQNAKLEVKRAAKKVTTKAKTAAKKVKK